MKDLTDVTLEDVVRYKGSRWKAKLDRAGVNRELLITELSKFLYDIPECRKVRAYILFGDGELMIDSSTTDYSTWLYNFYAKHLDLIDALKVEDGLDFPSFDDVKIKSVSTVIDNPAYREVEDLLADAQSSFRDQKRDVIDLEDTVSNAYRRISTLESKIALSTMDIESQEEKLSKIQPTTAYDLGGNLSDIDRALREYGFTPLTYSMYEDDNDVIVRFAVHPRLMYDQSVNRKPIEVMPFVMAMYIRSGNKINLESVYSLVKGGTWNAVHPHVARHCCWGSDLGRDVRKASVSGDYQTLISCFDRLVRSYNSGSPFITYSGYKRVANYTAMCGFKCDHRTEKLFNFIKDMTTRLVTCSDHILFRPYKFTDMLGADVLNEKTPEHIREAIQTYDDTVKRKYNEQQEAQSESESEERATAQTENTTEESDAIDVYDFTQDDIPF